MKFLTSLHPASSVCFSFIELFFCLLALKSWENTAGGESTQSYEALFSPPAPPLFPGTYRGNDASRLSANCCVFYIFPLLYHIFLLISYRIKIYSQYRHIPTTASRLFHSQQPLQAVLLHRLRLSFPAPSHTDTSQQNSRPPQPSTPKKKPEGCAEGPRLCGPFAVFLFPQKNTARHSPKKQTPHSI